MEHRVVALVDSPVDVSRALNNALSSPSFKLFETDSGRNLVQRLSEKKAELAIISSTGSSLIGVQTAARIRRQCGRLPLILISPKSTEDRVIEALRAGVNDYVKWPCRDSDLLASVKRTLTSQPAAALRWHEPSSQAPATRTSLIGHSEAMRRINDYLRSAAAVDSTVLITGETGTGKERVADSIHAFSPRRERRLICVNCAAVPDSLFESELFGHNKGAFTGANDAYEGKLRLADGGTVLLDEIGDMSPLAQTKILRAIESKHVYPLGSKTGLSLDFRVLAATNRDLEQMLEEGTFRKDLYYRLNVVRIHLPPLRERKEDIPQLITQQLNELNQRYGTAVLGLDNEAMELVIRYDWPGNVRELRNVVEASFINQPSQRIQAAHLPDFFREIAARHSACDSQAVSERDALLNALLSTNWNKSKAAEKLNWSRMTVYRKLRKYHIEEIGS